jgi:hypothetical protein
MFTGVTPVLVTAKDWLPPQNTGGLLGVEAFRLAT